MNIKIKNSFTNKIKFLMGAILFFAAFLIFCGVKAESINNISGTGSLSTDDKEELKELNEKAETYRKIIEIKQKQGETLSNQISITDASIGQIENQMKMISKQIEDLNDQIIRIQKEIKENEAMIEVNKKLLGQIMQVYYESSNTSPFFTYLSGGNLKSFMVKEDRISQTGDKIKELIDIIKKIKEDLNEENNQLDQKKSEFLSKNQELQEKNNDLNSIKDQKQSLLNETQGEEQRYQQLLAKIEAQKNELLNIDDYFSASGLSADSYPKPDSKYFASTSWYYSQWDSRWGNKNIGNTRTKMKNYGCAVTSVAMVFTEHGGSITPGYLASKPIFYGDLINWPSSWSSPKLSLISSKSHGNVSWSTIDSQIKKGNPVIVYIKKSNGSQGHYVVIHHKDAAGKYVVHDPYFGANIFLDTSRALVGALGSSSKTSIDQMIIYN